ncbi:MAG: TonB-dependent receptor [Planctomycetota bacterium]
MLPSLTALVALASAVALAQETNQAPDVPAEDQLPPVEENDGVLPEVVVEGRATSRIGFAPAASEGATGPEQLRRRPLLRPGEILETVPGVIITQHSGSGKGNQFFLRGFNLDHGTDFLVEVGGVPINLRSHGHGQGYVDLNFLIPELVEKVAYRKGPYFADTGDFSSAGSVAIDYVRDLPNGIALVESGQFGYQRALYADGFTLGRGRKLVTAVETLHHDGPWDVDENFRKINAFARVSQGDRYNGADFTAGIYDSRWVSTDHIAQRAVDQGLIGRFGTLDPTSGGDSRRFSLTGHWYGLDQDSSWDITAYAYRYQLDLFSNFTYFLNDQTDGDQFEQLDDRWTQGLHAERTTFTEISGKEVEWRYGLEFRNDFIDNGLFNTVRRQRRSTVRRDDIIETSFGIFADTTVRWTDNLRSTFGLRADAYRFDVDSDDDVNSGKENDLIANPNVGLAYGVAENTELYLNAGFGFHSNDARGVTIQDDPTTPEPLDGAPVPGLVRQRGAEIGVRHEDPSGLTSTFTLWGLRSDSELLFVGDGGNTEPTGATERFGVEWTNYWRFDDEWSLDLDVAWSQARFREGEDDHVPGAIEATLATGLAYESKSGHYAALRGRYFGPRDLEETGEVRSSTSFLVNAHGAYRINDDVLLRLSVFNLLDRDVNDIEYFYPSRLQGEPVGPDDGGFNDIHFHPSEPFAVRFGVVVAF